MTEVMPLFFVRLYDYARIESPFRGIPVVSAAEPQFSSVMPSILSWKDGADWK